MSDIEIRQRGAIASWLQTFCVTGQVVELRALKVQGKKAVCEVYSDLEVLASRAVELDRAGATGCYFTPNPLRPELVGWKDSRIKATDVLARHWLLIDCDSDKSRPTGTNATDQEKEVSWRVLDRCKSMLDTFGMSNAVIGDSGNGFHLCYPVSLPNDESSQDLMKQILKGLSERCGDKLTAEENEQIKTGPLPTPKADVTLSTHDAPRIWKLYGTMARKGPHSAERPHRYARLVGGPQWEADVALLNSERLKGILDHWKTQRDFQQNRPQGGATPFDRARAYVAQMPPAISGQGGHDKTFEVAQILVRGFSLAFPDAWRIITEYNQRCQPPWTDKELWHKLESAEKDSRLAQGYMLNGSQTPPIIVNGVQVEQEPVDDGSQTATLADVARVLSRVEWLWPNWLQKGALVGLASEPGVGKTRFVMDLIRRIRNRLSWPDGSEITLPADAPVLYLPADGQYAELTTIASEYSIDPGTVLLNSRPNDPFGGTDLDNRVVMNGLCARVQRMNPALVVIDTVGSSTEKDLCSNEKSRSFCKPLIDLAVRQQTTILLVTHLNAGGGTLGRRLEQFTRQLIKLERPDPDNQPLRRKLWVHKSHAVHPPALGVTMGGSGNEYDTTPPVPQSDDRARGGRRSTATDKAAEWLRDRLANGPVRVSVLRTAAEAEEITPPALYRARDTLKCCEYREGGKQFWKLPDAKPDNLPDSSELPPDWLPD